MNREIETVGAVDTPVAFWWRAPDDGQTWVASDGRPIQVEEIAPDSTLCRIRTLVRHGKFTLDAGPIDATTAVADDESAELPFSLTIDGLDLVNADAGAKRGPLARFFSIDYVPAFGFWVSAVHHLTLDVWELEIVILNGELNDSGEMRPIGATRSIPSIAVNGVTLLHGERCDPLHFGAQRTYRVIVKGDGSSAWLQDGPLPTAGVRLPLGYLAAVRMLWRAPKRIAGSTASDVNWDPYDLGGGPWSPSLDSGGGKPELAPYPQWDVAALLDPQRVQASRQNAYTFPYGFFWFDAIDGEALTPSDYPEGWCDGTRLERFRDFRGEDGEQIYDILEDGPVNPYKTDPAHLPNAFYVPAMLTGSMALGKLLEWYTHGVAMFAGRGRAGMDTPATGPIPQSRINGRGPTGAEGGIAGTYHVRGWAWVLWQRAHAVRALGCPVIYDLLDSALNIFGGGCGMYSGAADMDWGRRVRPLLWPTFHGSGNGRRDTDPPLSVTDGLTGYARPGNSIRMNKVSSAESSFQSAFLSMAVDFCRNFTNSVRIMPLLTFANSRRAQIIREGKIPHTLYVWPSIDDAGKWIASPTLEHYVTDPTPGYRPLELRKFGGETFNNLNAYGNEIYGHVGDLALEDTHPEEYALAMARHKVLESAPGYYAKQEWSFES